MNPTDDWNPAVILCHRDRTKALLAYAMERQITGHGWPLDRPGDGPWDVWWVCYRAQRMATEFGLDPRHTADRCEVCAVDASRLAFYTPPSHPQGAPRGWCTCLLDWARSMRRPGPDIIWPGWRLTVSMVKPGSDPALVRELLVEGHDVVGEIQRRLTPADVRRLYPDAYGREYVARRDDYLTSAPVTVFVLLASLSAIGKAKDNRVGGGVAPPPLTPPDMRARIRRFVKPFGRDAARSG
ncbi:MAG: hypothetical protein M3Y48_23130 [Actinomycetota bacterium]|nr:hypothetical protein [Actinomycetota bacterium]